MEREIILQIVQEIHHEAIKQVESGSKSLNVLSLIIEHSSKTPREWEKDTGCISAHHTVLVGQVGRYLESILTRDMPNHKFTFRSSWGSEGQIFVNLNNKPCYKL